MSNSLLEPYLKECPLVVIISGPSGVGKDAVLNRMKARHFPADFITTVTTRSKRANEIQGKDYNFISESAFQELLNQGGLLEHARVYGNWYGVPRAPVKEALKKGRDVIIKVDVQGAATIKKIIPQAVFIFLAPPSMDELSSRLTQRRTESADDLSVRLKTAEGEIDQVRNFDYIVFNHGNRIDGALDQISAILASEKCRSNRREVCL
jgi:guanylate kinase